MQPSLRREWILAYSIKGSMGISSHLVLAVGIVIAELELAAQDFPQTVPHNAFASIVRRRKRFNVSLRRSRVWPALPFSGEPIHVCLVPRSNCGVRIFEADTFRKLIISVKSHGYS